MTLRRLLALAFLLPLAACGGKHQSASSPDAQRASQGRPAATDSLAADPHVVVNIDPAYLLRVTLARDGRQYTADVIDGRLEMEGRDVGASLAAWLQRYAPLRADGRIARPGLDPDSLVLHSDAQVSVFFDDGSGRVVSVRRLGGDSLAVVSRPEGPVFRLGADRLDALVPPPEALTNG